MKLKLKLLAGAAIAVGLSLSTWAQKSGKDPSPTPLGPEKPFNEFNDIQVWNYQDEQLGRIKDLGIDLVNGRIVEVLVISNSKLAGPKKVVAVPPLALSPDPLKQVYRINVSAEVFNSAPRIDLKEWGEGSNRSDRVAATYRHFGQEPYFLEEGQSANTTADQPRTQIGYVERCSKIVDLPVGNLQNEKFGKVWGLALDIPKGRIIHVTVIAPGNFKTKSVIPAMALSFNPARNGLLLDDTKAEFADEPRYVFTEAAFGQDAYSEQEADTARRSSVALQQGSSYRDVDRTLRINQDIRAAKVNGRNVQVVTINGRVTLRGWVYTEEDKRRIGEIAIAASREEVVDNQILVGKPVTAN